MKAFLRTAALLLGLGLSGCVSLLVNPGGLGCEEGSAARCEESELVLCVEGVELRQDCAPGVCLAELGACGGGPACGDGIQDAGEECDDGNTQNGDGCDAACLLEAGPDCGNGVQDAGEQCDDANNSNTDACTNACRDADCGDGFLQPVNGEQCDDGNNKNGDGCSSSCAKEVGPDCGDGVLNAGEECDDGNNSNTDACTNSCEEARCGDGFLQPVNGEQCDDTNPSNTDACLNSCQNARCGDGFVRAGVEGCDDGNVTNGDGCSSLCQDEPAFCGDGILNLTEECDDGNLINGDGCNANCDIEDCSHDLCEEGAALVSGCDPCVAQVCAADSFCCDNTWDSFCVSGAVSICGLSCNTAVCGNGLVEVGEECDDGNANPGNFSNDTCDPNCQFPGCGNGFVGFFEAFPGFPFPEGCDDGNLTNGDGCDSSCFTESNAVCGNGVQEAGEGCDDGNNTNTDACTNACQDAACGDGFVQAVNGEQCDDGNVSNGDGCSAACQNESTCAHDFCEEGGALVSSCDPCVVQICAADAFCCNNTWDSLCVGQVASVCGLSCGGGGFGLLLINEVDYDQLGTDANSFIEVFNAGNAPVSLAAVELSLINGLDGVEYARIPLAPAGTLNAGQFVVVRNPTVSVAGGALVIDRAGDFLQNGPDGVLLLSNGSIIDDVVYETNDATFFPSFTSFFTGADTPDNLNSVSRIPNGNDTNSGADWVLRSPSPGASNF